MRTRYNLVIHVSVIFLLFLFNNYSSAYNLRQYSSKNGLSNSAVLSICQDGDGFMWFGSCEGVNFFDGLNFQLYNPIDKKKILSGNIVESILEAENNILWIQTNYGLDRLEKYSQTVHSFRQFKGKNWVVNSTDNRIFVVNSDNYIYYYVPEEQQFRGIQVDNLIADDILEVAIDKRNILWIFMKSGNNLSFSINSNPDGSISLEPKKLFDDEEKVMWCFYDDDTFYIVDNKYALYEYDPASCNKYYIYDLSDEVKRYGEISAIIQHKGEYFIGFKSSGLIVLQHIPESKDRYSIHDINIKSGIFCIEKDKFQDIIWVGTDGQGVYMYYNDSYTLRTTLLRDLPYNLNTPIRTFYIDEYGTFWFGTKGNGIVKIENYDAAVNEGEKSVQFLTNNSLLKSNSVYTIVPGKKDILWIGSENGLNYYSYKSSSIKNIDILGGNKPLRYVYSVCEFNDSTLWIATVGEGIVKAKLGEKDGNPVLKKDTTFLFDNGVIPSNYFFTSYKENDSIIWFGNRGYGAYKINNRTNKIEVYSLNEGSESQTLNDVFSILKSDKSYWFATSYGLARIYYDRDRYVFDKTNVLPKNVIHGMLQDEYNNLWLSTNRGLIKYNVSENTFQTYWKQNDLQVTEFSDGAYFKHIPSGTLFFGGINGFVTVSVNGFPKLDYNPEIQFSNLSIFGKEYNINDFVSIENSRKNITLNYEQNFFSLSFTAIDYINGNDYTYFYKLAELSDIWIDNGGSNSASFTNISPGRYTLLVKYRNNITGKESAVQSLVINISYPWYQTTLAYVVYTLLLLLVGYCIVRLSIKWYRMKKENIVEKLTRKQREDVYESKLRFFTNITHELCTPLTLIYGPCEKIISYDKSDSLIIKYAKLIKHNAEELNSLIAELIEFRRLETGHKKVEIKSCPISELARNIAEPFSELTSNKLLDYRINIVDNIYWNSDSGCLNKIITNLISNAFKYASVKGKISVDVYVEDKKLYIVVANTGKGIKEDDLSKIFDRYTVLDNFEDQNKAHETSRNGLGLAICNNMVKLLEGEITVTSVLNDITTFTVILPELSIEQATEGDEFFGNASVTVIENVSRKMEETSSVPEIVIPEYDKNKQTIMIIDDDSAMLWFVTEIFIDKYNVIPINNSTEVMSCLEQSSPDIIISDIMMPDIDGISLTTLIKGDKLRKHIPMILLSAKNTVEDQVRGIDSGAEVYITKPFRVRYLEKVVERLIKRKEDLKQYFSSAVSSFEINEGKLVHEEDKKFMEKVYQVIDSNITNPELSIETISSSLGYSTRQFYRRIKEITPKKPNDIIREYKLDIVKKLLINTNLSVEEIMDRTGFINRGNFFKIFSQKFEMTPKKYREQMRKDITKTNLENS